MTLDHLLHAVTRASASRFNAVVRSWLAVPQRIGVLAVHDVDSLRRLERRSRPLLGRSRSHAVVGNHAHQLVVLLFNRAVCGLHVQVGTVIPVLAPSVREVVTYLLCRSLRRRLLMLVMRSGGTDRRLVVNRQRHRIRGSADG